MSPHPTVPHLALEDHTGRYTRVGFEYASAIETAIAERADFVRVRTLRGISVRIDPSSITRVYELDSACLQILAATEHECRAERSLEALGIASGGTIACDDSALPPRPLGFD